MRLIDLAPGAVARVQDLALDEEAGRLLRALGLTPSCRFRVCQAGDPWILQVRSTRIGLTAAVAAAILVVPDADAA